MRSTLTLFALDGSEARLMPILLHVRWRLMVVCERR